MVTILSSALVSELILSTAAQTPNTAPRLAQSQAIFYRMKVGDFKVTALSSGTVPLPVFDLLTGIKRSEIEKLLANARVTAPLDASVNAFLLIARRSLDSKNILLTESATLYNN